MATHIAIRWRRSAAERHALERVEREIRATDPHGRRKYLRDFADAFREYQSVLTSMQLDGSLYAADVLLVGDYHALPASQRYAVELIEKLAAANRPVVLALEMVFARDQHILDEWMRGEIDDAELRERIRFDLDWGYDWSPFRDVLKAGRSKAKAIYGLDCMPRDDMRRIGARDRHAAERIADIRRAHPEAQIVVLFGESHLAPSHLPFCLRRCVADDRVLTVLQNVDALYWQASGERRENVRAVRVSEDAVCVFNATPLEKYESYRLCIERWKRERAACPDLAPTFYNLIDALLRFFAIDKFSVRNTRLPIVDMFPEVCSRSTPESFAKLLTRKCVPEAEFRTIMQRLTECGSSYMPRLNAVLVTNFQMQHATADAARFVHAACRDAAQRPKSLPAAEDAFYRDVIEDAFAWFGSRVLYPARTPMREQDLYVHYARSREEVEEKALYSYREYMQMIDFLVLHKDYEQNVWTWLEVPQLMREGVFYAGARRDFSVRTLGHILGTEMYDAYIAGRLHKRTLRSLFSRSLDEPSAARTLYFTIVRRIRTPRRRRLAA